MSNKKTSYNSFITKVSEKNYRVDFSYISPETHKRKRTCKRGFERLQDAKNWERDELPNLIAIMEEAPKTIATMTMKDLIEDYIEVLVSRRKASTQQTKLNIINNKILPYFADKKVKDIGKVDIERWQNKINNMETSEGYGLEDTYKYTIRSQLIAIMNYAVSAYDLPFNPVYKTEKIGKKRASKQPFWDLSEYAKFRKVAAEKPEFYYFFELLYWTGMRSGEAKALCVRDINFDKKFIRVYKTLSDEATSIQAVKLSKKKAKMLLENETDPKATGSYRDIHLPQLLVDELKEYVDSLYKITPDTHIFDLAKSSMHRELDRCIQATGITDITIHGIRHSANSLLSNVVRCSDVIRKYRLGHCDESTNDIYNHPYNYNLEEVATKLNEIMEELDNVSNE